MSQFSSLKTLDARRQHGREYTFAIMSSLIPVFVVLGIAVALVAIMSSISRKPQKKSSQGAETPPFKRKDWLLTRAERDFFHALQLACGDGRHVFAKVRMEDLLWLPKGTEKRQSWRGRVKSRHIDFVVCDLATSRPLVAIELDDASHGRRDRRERDAFVDSFLRPRVFGWSGFARAGGGMTSEGSGSGSVVM